MCGFNAWLASVDLIESPELSHVARFGERVVGEPGRCGE